MPEDDDTQYRIIRKGTRPRRSTQPSTPRALAEGSGVVPVERQAVDDDPRDPLATAPTASLLPSPMPAATLPPPVGETVVPMRTRAATLPSLSLDPTAARTASGSFRDGTPIEFGNMTLRVRHHGGVVHIELSDGTRLSGSDAQACELAAVLLRAGARR